MELSAEADFGRLLKLEEEFVEKMCDEIAAVKPDLVITEKGVSGRRGLTWLGVFLFVCSIRFGSTFSDEEKHHSYQKSQKDGQQQNS